MTKPLAGHLAKAGAEAGEIIQEFRIDADLAGKYAAGATVPVADLFAAGQQVDVQGTTIGKGYAGTIKRHHMSSQRASHGNSRSHNVPGSKGGFVTVRPAVKARPQSAAKPAPAAAKGAK